jgi:hypothetical protein
MEKKLLNITKQHGIFRSIRAGEMICPNLQTSGVVLYIDSGLVEVVYYSTNPEKLRAVGEVKDAGRWVGLAMALHQTSTQWVELKALTDCRVMTLSIANLNSCLAISTASVDSCFSIVTKLLASELTETTNNFKQYILEDSFERFCTSLKKAVDLGVRNKTSCKLPYTPDDIARFTGNSKEMTRRYTVRLIKEEKIYLDNERKIHVIGDLHEQPVLV